jgi:two-component system, chemotaxis family, chemotaxis protein CheY
MACRVLIVEDDAAFAEILELLLREHGSFEIVGRATNGHEAIELARRLSPDVVTMDLDMPQLDGVAATRAILEVDADQQIVVVSGSLVEDRIAASREAGAAAFVAKARAVDDLPDVLIDVCRGVAFVARD